MSGPRSSAGLLRIILIIVAAICFLLATFGFNSPISLVPLGLLAWLLSGEVA